MPKKKYPLKPKTEYVRRAPAETEIIIPEFPKNSPYARPMCTKVNWSYLAFPACNVYMPEGKIETLSGQGNVFFDIMYNIHEGLTFTDANSGVTFTIGHPSIMELFKFLETLGMRLVVDHPYPEGFETLRKELAELRAIMKYSSYKRGKEMEYGNELRRQAKGAMHTYGKICRYRLNYDANNKALGELTEVLKGNKDMSELKPQSLDFLNRY